jgi:hypothetical protein
MLIADLQHASWHSIVRTGHVFFHCYRHGIGQRGSHLPFLFHMPVPTGSTGLIISASLPLHAAYKASLAVAYRTAEFDKACGASHRALAGWASFTTWIIVLDSLSSVLFAVIIDVLFLRERASPTRMACAAFITIGLTLTATFGQS